jgi:lipopolysaccharide biosynthesis regulator YciM
MRLYEELAEEDPENTDYLAALGRLAARRGDRDQALRISAPGSRRCSGIRSRR